MKTLNEAFDEAWKRYGRRCPHTHIGDKQAEQMFHELDRAVAEEWFIRGWLARAGDEEIEG